MLLKISAKEKDFQETVRLLDNIIKAFPGIPIREKEVDTDTAFQEFRQSDEYKQWIARTQPTHN